MDRGPNAAARSGSNKLRVLLQRLGANQIRSGGPEPSDLKRNCRATSRNTDVIANVFDVALNFERSNFLMIQFLAWSLRRDVSSEKIDFAPLL